MRLPLQCYVKLGFSTYLEWKEDGDDGEYDNDGGYDDVGRIEV
jgi:hypothetical protein